MMNLSIYIHHDQGGDPRYIRHNVTREPGTSLNVRTPWGAVVPWEVPATPGDYLVTAHEPEGPERVVAQIIAK